MIEFLHKLKDKVFKKKKLTDNPFFEKFHLFFKENLIFSILDRCSALFIVIVIIILLEILRTIRIFSKSPMILSFKLAIFLLLFIIFTFSKKIKVIRKIMKNEQIVNIFFLFVSKLIVLLYVEVALFLQKEFKFWEGIFLVSCDRFFMATMNNIWQKLFSNLLTIIYFTIRTENLFQNIEFPLSFFAILFFEMKLEIDKFKIVQEYFIEFEKYAQKKKFQKYFLDNIPEIIVVLNKQYEVKYANNASYKYLSCKELDKNNINKSFSKNNEKCEKKYVKTLKYKKENIKNMNNMLFDGSDNIQNNYNEIDIESLLNFHNSNKNVINNLIEKKKTEGKNNKKNSNFLNNISNKKTKNDFMNLKNNKNNKNIEKMNSEIEKNSNKSILVSSSKSLIEKNGSIDDFDFLNNKYKTVESKKKEKKLIESKIALGYDTNIISFNDTEEKSNNLIYSESSINFKILNEKEKKIRKIDKKSIFDDKTSLIIENEKELEDFEEKEEIEKKSQIELEKKIFKRNSRELQNIILKENSPIKLENKIFNENSQIEKNFDEKEKINEIQINLENKILERNLNNDNETIINEKNTNKSIETINNELKKIQKTIGDTEKHNVSFDEKNSINSKKNENPVSIENIKTRKKNANNNNSIINLEKSSPKKYLKELKNIIVNNKFFKLNKKMYLCQKKNLVEILDFLKNNFFPVWKNNNTLEKFGAVFNINFLFTSTLKIDKVEKNLEFTIIPALINQEEHFLLIGKDKSYTQKIEELEKVNENKTTHMNSVAHELRTPLNGIISMLNMVQLTIDSELNNNYVKPSIDCAKILLNLINDLLDSEQIRQGKFKLTFVEFDLKKTLKNSINLFKIQAKNRGIKLILIYEKNIPKIFTSDPNRIHQIIVNLIGNAMKFTIKGCIKLKIKKKNNLIYEISVKDSGIGISKGNQKKLFKAFGKIDLGEQNKLNSQGVGLGLVISNNLAKHLGPNPDVGLQIKSDEKKGSKFFFSIKDHSNFYDENYLDNIYVSSDSLESYSELEKYKDENDEEILIIDKKIKKSTNIKNLIINNPKFLQSYNDFDKLNSEKKEIDSSVLNKTKSISLKSIKSLSKKNPILNEKVKEYFSKCKCEKILIVDDNDFNIMSLTLILNHLKLSSVNATNGEEALTIILEKSKKNCCPKFEIIFMDCEMPILNGYETSEILQKKMDTFEIPKQIIIATTAHQDNETINKCIECGMNDYIAKPITIKNLIILLNKWVFKSNNVGY